MIDKKLEKDIDIAIELLKALKEDYTSRAMGYNSRQHNKEKVKRTRLMINDLLFRNEKGVK
jgi:hypothetical protein|nr:MAG TPA: hypothetical protein [Caudoviricetes sp.]